MRKHFGLALTALLLAANSAGAHQVPLRFIKVQRISVDRAAAYLNVAFARAASADLPDGSVPVQVVPAHRTSEVFVMGRTEDIQRAAAILALLDRFWPFPWL